MWNYIRTLIDKQYKFKVALDTLDEVYNKIDQDMNVYTLLSMINAFPEPRDTKDPKRYAENIMESLNSGLEKTSTIRPDFDGRINYKNGNLVITISDYDLVAAILATVLYSYSYTNISARSLALILYQKFQVRRINFHCKRYLPSTVMDEVWKLMIYKKDSKVEAFCRQLYVEVRSLLSEQTPV